MNILSTALMLASKDYCVVPTRADGTKAPVGDWKRWQHERPDAKQLQTWLKSGSFDGIGLVCGSVSGNLEMLELEGRAIAEGVSVQMAEIADASGLGDLWSRIVTGYSETSPSGGIHFLYRVQGSVAGNTKLARRPSTPEELEANPDEKVKVLVETRGEGGYVVIAPSNGRTHETGKPWTMLAGGIDTIPTITADERDALHILARAVDAMPVEATQAKPSSASSGAGPDTAGDYNAKTSWDDILLDRGWAKVFTAGTVTYWRRPGKQHGISATTGRNDADNLYVFSSSTEFDTERPYSRFAAYALLEHRGDLSAAGKALFKQGYGRRGPDERIDLPKADTGHQQPAEPTEAEKQPHDHEADLANARWLVAMHGERLRYVVPRRKWLVWDGTRWELDDSGQAWRDAKEAADMLPRKHKGRPTRVQTKAGIRDMLELAGTEPNIAVTPAMLDSHPRVLNVQNGTLDLQTMQLSPHDPADLLTKICGAAHDPGAEAPEFTAFLERIQPDPEMRSFLARLFGHALLGTVVEHVLAILYGTGANGKSTLVEAVMTAFGDYAAPTDPGLLIDRGDVHPTGTADLFGLRLAVTHETDEGRRLAEGTVKRLTGGDTIKARGMREDFWSFTPSHSIVMHTNHKPIVRGSDEGIWRRLRFVPFDIVIPEDERDGKLWERLQQEKDGILAWIIRGYQEWVSRGLDEPSSVTEATAAFRGESDMLATFLEQRCLLNPYTHVRSGELFEAWVQWCKIENHDAGTQTKFSRELVDRGFDKDHTMHGKVWRGIGLLTAETDKEASI